MVLTLGLVQVARALTLAGFLFLVGALLATMILVGLMALAFIFVALLRVSGFVLFVALLLVLLLLLFILFLFRCLTL